MKGVSFSVASLALPVMLLAAGGVGVPTPAAHASGAPADVMAPAAYTAELTADQLRWLWASGVDREDIRIFAAPSAGRARVEVVTSAETATRLRARGVGLTAKRQTQASQAYQVFRSYSQAGGIRDELVRTANDHPALTKLVTLGRTVQGRDILAVKVTRDARRLRDGVRPSVLHLSAQHAREWITVEMTRRLLHHYLDRYGNEPEITRLVDTTELWFVPVANPDGYDWTFTSGQRLWRKNLRDNNNDGRTTGVDGVDLNRNFAYTWGYDNEGSSPSPERQSYRGPSPASDPKNRVRLRVRPLRWG